MNITVYLPDHLADKVRGSDMNVSAVCRQALHAELRKHAPMRSAEDIASDPHVDPKTAKAVLKDFGDALHEIINMILCDERRADVHEIFKVAHETCRRQWRVAPTQDREDGGAEEPAP